ncbi:hypothetical protein [Sessilibacter sp. MAH2]
MKQTEIADYLDLSERQLRTVLSRLGLDHRVHSLDDIRIAYIRDLREKAAGREVTDTKERLDLAKAEDAEINTQIKIRQLLREDQLIVLTDDVELLLDTWIMSVRTEFFSAINQIIEQLESKHLINVERKDIDKIIDRATRVISDTNFESIAGDREESSKVVTA